MRRAQLLISRVPPPLLFAGVGILLIVLEWASAPPLWLDEEMIALNVRDRGFSGLAGALWLDQTAPVGWLLLQRFVFMIFGSSELAVRAVPALFGIATLACAAWVGHRWLGMLGGALFVLLCSFGEWIVFYAIELKHYSADAFWGLFLPALTIWTIESPDQKVGRRRLFVSGALVAIGHWFAYGALFVTPVCAAFVLVVSVIRRDLRMLKGFAVAGAMWLLSFGLHYELAIRHGRESNYLQEFWAFALPQVSAGLGERVSWVSQQLPPLAQKPGGTEFWLMFWLLSAAGFVFARQKLLGMMAAATVVSGLTLAALRIVPLYERLTLWFLPALYLGIALFADNVGPLFHARRLGYRWLQVAAASAIALPAVYLGFDVVRRGVEEQMARPSESNRAFDDRSAVLWLMSQHRPGDALITTHLGLPAVWWYGDVSIGTDAGGSQFSDGSPIFVAEYRLRRQECRGRGLRRNLGEDRRVLVYLGFEDMPKGFDDLLLEALSRFGTVTLRHFGRISRAAVIDPAGPPAIAPFWEDADGTLQRGCVVLREARRW